MHESPPRRGSRSAWGRLRLALSWLVIAVAIVVVVVEVAGRAVTQRIIEDQIRASGVAGGVDVTIGRSWWQPSIVGVVLFETLDKVEVRLTDARLYSTHVDEADYVLNELGLDLSIANRKVSVQSLGSGSVRVLIDPSALARMFGVDATIRDGRLFVAGSDTPARVSISGTDLVIEAAAIASPDGSHSISLPVVDPAILPCTPKVRLVDRFVELRCTGTRLPGVLATSLAAESGSDIGPGGDQNLPPLDETELPPPATLELPGSTSTTEKSDSPSGGG